VLQVGVPAKIFLALEYIFVASWMSFSLLPLNGNIRLQYSATAYFIECSPEVVILFISNFFLASYQKIFITNDLVLNHIIFDFYF
jgi:hypothetical protein